jgi:hypothetical protein
MSRNRNPRTVRPEQGTELVEGPVSKGRDAPLFDEGFDRLSANGSVSGK